RLDRGSSGGQEGKSAQDSPERDGGRHDEQGGPEPAARAAPLAAGRVSGRGQGRDVRHDVLPGFRRLLRGRYQFPGSMSNSNLNLPICSTTRRPLSWLNMGRRKNHRARSAPRRDELEQTTRQRLLETAGQVFAEKGFD